MAPISPEEFNTWHERLSRLQFRFHLEIGFEALYKRQAQDWENIIHPWLGVPRLVPGASALGLKHWRHATAGELLAWILDDGEGWPPLHPPVLALGSIYRRFGTPMVLPGINGTALRLTTHPVPTSIEHNMNKRLQHFLQVEPSSYVLCVVPRA